MMNQFWLRIFLGCCILLSSFAAVEKNNRSFNGFDSGENHGFHKNSGSQFSGNNGFRNTAFHSVETVRQCSCKEVQQCFHFIWSEMNCTYWDGSSLNLVSEGKELEFLDQCSSLKIQDYCTLEGTVFISISDVGYVFSKNLRQKNEQLCFNQNMIKCFKSHGCDIVSHNIVLKKIHDECNKESLKREIELMIKYPELYTSDQIENEKAYYFEKYNETIGSKNVAKNNMINVVLVFGFIAFSFLV